jgi:preprotein translocase subunit SecY
MIIRHSLLIALCLIFAFTVFIIFHGYFWFFISKHNVQPAKNVNAAAMQIVTCKEILHYL